MPGHKGKGPLGCEKLDITEISGADALYEADGIISESERNASALFGSRRTLYSTEGSSQCIRAMLYLALSRTASIADKPVCLAARNAHKAFLYAAALCDFDVQWLLPEQSGNSICACPVSPEGLDRALDRMKRLPFCVYVTSPDYLGNQLDIAGLAKVCHRREIPLLVDNAHGAYLKFLPDGMHPMESGADMCCDSAHKTLPVLTGGAYLHISHHARECYEENARSAMALFGSTSPSYLILQSLDFANAALARDYPARLLECSHRVKALRKVLLCRGFQVLSTEPCKLTLRTDGFRAAQLLRQFGVECEYADADYLVLMFSPENSPEDYERVDRALSRSLPCPCKQVLPSIVCPRVLDIRKAIFAPSELLPIEQAEGRICASPTVSCPPAIPIVISGERITSQAIQALRSNGIVQISVVKEPLPSKS